MTKGNWIAAGGIAAILLAQLLTLVWVGGGMSADIKSLQREVVELRQDIRSGAVTLR